MTGVTLMQTKTTATEANRGPFAALFRWIWHRYATARAANELAALDDRMLADLGLSRGQIGEAVRTPRFH
jgi:uncharacterized protein YjiS (DUF1127 family)